MLDIADEIDAAIGAPPATAPAIEETLTLGRRALLRRRIATGAGATACALVVGAAAWAVTPGGGPSGGTDNAPFADRSTTAEADGRPGKETRDDKALEGSLLATYGPDGEIVIKDGWRVTRRVPNPLGLEPPEDSVGLEITNDRSTFWYLLDRTENGSGSVSDPAQKGFATFEEWLASVVDANQPDPLMDALDLDAAGRIRSYDDAVTVVDQRIGVDLGAWGPAADTTVAELRYEGERWFVAALNHVDGGSVIGAAVNTPKAGSTLDSAIEYLRGQYDSGEGTR